MLNSLVERVNSTQLTEKDPDAESLLTRGFSQNPDAVYILAQSVLVQNIALEQAKIQLTQAQQQVQQLQQHPAHATSFLGRLLGDKDAPPAQAPQYQPVYSPQPTEYQAPYQGQSPYPGQPYQGQPYPGQGYGGAPGYGAPGYVPQGQPSFLRSAAQTAAGVAAGALVFEGVESMLHGGFGHPGMGMGMGGWGMPGVGMGMGPGFERPIEENVVNNYYDSPGGERHEGGEHQFADDSGNSGQLADDSWSEPGNDDGGGGSGFDDSSSFDDGGSGSGDDSGGF